jgi:hypothetical protein
MRAALSYRLQRTILGATFTRNATAGSGVFLGAETYQWEATVSRPLARVWNASGNFGYARNTSFEQLPLPERQFNSMFVGAQFSRVIGRTMSAYFSYNFQHQTSNAPVCLGCSDSFNRQFVGVGFEWHSRPMALDQF